MSAANLYDDNDQDSEHTPTPSPLFGKNNMPTTTYVIQNGVSSNDSIGSRERSTSKSSRSSKSKPTRSRSSKTSKSNNRSSVHNMHKEHRDYRDYREQKENNMRTQHRSLSAKNHHHPHSHPPPHHHHHHQHQYQQQHQHHHRRQHHHDNVSASNSTKQQKKKASPSSSISSTPSSSSSSSSSASRPSDIMNENIVSSKKESNNSNMNVEQLPNRKKLVIIAVGDNPLPSHAAFDFIHCKVGMERKVMWKNFDVMVLIVPTNTASKKKEIMFEACKKAKKINPKLFICIIDIEASESAVFRSKCFGYGANMVTNDHHSLKQVLNIIGNKGFSGRGRLSCPYCGMGGLTEDELWHHVPLYHVNASSSLSFGSKTQRDNKVQCPICGEDKKSRTFLLHLRNNHGPVIRGEIAPEYRDGILTHAFALVVVRRPTDGKFLVVQEASNSGFWLPGGRVEVGETLLEAAKRETKEEAGIDVDIKGVLKVEHSTYSFDERNKAYNRMRVIFYAEPVDEKELPKSVPNYDSAGATFISVEELDEIELRAEEPREWFNALTHNFYYHSLNILSCWKHDHRSPDHPKKYYYDHEDQQQQTQNINTNMNINTKENITRDSIDANDRYDLVASEDSSDAEVIKLDNAQDDELDDRIFKQRAKKNSTIKRRHTANVSQTSPFTVFPQEPQAQINLDEYRIRSRGPSEPIPPTRSVMNSRAQRSKPNKQNHIKRSKTPKQLMHREGNKNKNKNNDNNVKKTSKKSNRTSNESQSASKLTTSPKASNVQKPVANQTAPQSPKQPQQSTNNNNSNTNKASTANATQAQQQPQYQQVTYMMYQPFTPSIIPNVYYPPNIYPQPQPQPPPQRQSMHLPLTQQRAPSLKKQISADTTQPQQQPIDPNATNQATAAASDPAQQFYLQQIAMQQAQIHAQYNVANRAHPFYINQPLSPGQGRNSTMAIHNNNNIIYHTAAAQPPHVNAMYQQQQQQQPLIYTPFTATTTSKTEINKTENIQIANFHNKQQPKLELKSSVKKDKKNRKNNTSQSDALLRKRKHRRSSSNTLPQRNTLHSNFHPNTTPPPGPIYSDQLNAISAQRGIVGGNNSSNKQSK